MSTASKVTLAASIVGTASIVVYVHFTQVQDKTRLRQVTRKQHT